MEGNVGQLITLITKMQDRQEAMQKETSDHLLKLRENVHDIKNDYHGVSQLTVIVKKELDEEKKRTEATFETAFSRIRANEKDIAAIKPQAASFTKVSDNVTKTLTSVVIAAVLGMVVFFGTGMKIG